MVEKAALADGESKLVSEAPTDFRSIVQTAMSSTEGNNVEFSQIDTKLRRVRGLTGIKYHNDKMTCRKIVRYGTFATLLDRQCWAVVSVPIESLKEAYARTIREIYGDKKATEFNQRMNDEIKKMDQ